MPQVKARVDRGGRVVIPAEYRRATELRAGEEVILSLRDGEVRVLTVAAAIRQAQAPVRRYVPEGRSLSDELITERRIDVDLE